MMRWRKPTEIPEDNSLVWIMTYPHKSTPASCEIHGGWVCMGLESTKFIWFIDNQDEIGSGSASWYAYNDKYDVRMDDYSSHCISETIMAWIPAEEFIYPEWLEENYSK